MKEFGHNQQRILKDDLKEQYWELKPQISQILRNTTKNDTKGHFIDGVQDENINPVGSKLQPQLGSLKG